MLLLYPFIDRTRSNTLLTKTNVRQGTKSTNGKSGEQTIIALLENGRVGISLNNCVNQRSLG